MPLKKKMAAKSKKRLSLENKLLKLDKLELSDVICSICQSILIEPVTLPCFHDFCHSCFNGSIENNALCCPLCRLRIGSWLRTTTKRRNLVNIELWQCIQSKFPEYINNKKRGVDVVVPEDKPKVRLSAPGEIRFEYEAELKRLREERLLVEQKHRAETELLIQKIQKEEEEAHKKYLEALKRDELLAQEMQKQLKSTVPPNTPNTRKFGLKSCAKPRLKDTRIDGYLSKLKQNQLNSPLLTDDNTNSTSSSTPKAPIQEVNNANSPEMVPTYSKIIKSIIDKKNKFIPGLWNKENGDKQKDKREESKTVTKQSKQTNMKDTEFKPKIVKKSNGQSLLVSLPLTNIGLIQHLTNLNEIRKETGSVDSMRQELCYFKPIEEITITSSGKRSPIRVPGNRVQIRPSSPVYEPPPSRAQYLEGLCKLRELSLVKNLPSAFVIALKSLQVVTSSKCMSRARAKKRLSTSPSAVVPTKSVRRNPNRNKQINYVESTSGPTNLRRTRSMGSISKSENQSTPKKAKIKGRKVASDRKPYLRSDSKRTTKKGSVSPPEYGVFNNNKIELAVKNLSSPLKNCDVKELLQEQIRIEKIIEQEKNDLELARKVQAELNGRRPRRAAVKRQVTLNYALRPAKKLKV